MRDLTQCVWATLVLAAILILLNTPPSRGEVPDLASLFAELNALDTPNYTGGLPRRNRALAAQIRAEMATKFPEISCEPTEGAAGTIIGIIGERAEQGEVPKNLDPNLAQLLKAFEHERQEVRDTAAYTIGLLGPSAKNLEPALRIRFAVPPSERHQLKGNWHNDAYARVTCQSVAAADFRQVIPDAMLPPEKPWNDFLRQAAVLIATLYLDEDVEYPPDMMGYAYSNYAIASEAGPAVPLLARILESDRLSAQKQAEAASALGTVEPDIAKQALPALLRHTGTKDPQLRFAVTEVLVRLKHEAAIPLLVQRIEEQWWHFSWERALCEYGLRAITAETALLKLLHREDAWPTDVRSAVIVLGCIGSKRSIPELLPLLALPDWETQEVVAAVLGRLGDAAPDAIAALERLAAAHWSSRVRTAAERALKKLTGRYVDDGSIERFEVVDVFWSPQPIDHGLPWCNERGKYSIDGKLWFDVAWTKLGIAPVPKGFKRAVTDYGTRHFLRVDEGWLYAADRWHYGGELEHVADDGRVTPLSVPWHTAAGGFLRDGKAILAFGNQILISGYGGVLFDVARGADGVWKATRIAALPSGATNAFATGPNGEVLLSDQANQYAVIARQVVPLQCARTHKGSYFDKYK